MSFSELWDGFEKCVDLGENMEKFSREVLKYINKKVDLEGNHVKSSRRVLNSFSEDVEFGSMLDCWLELKKQQLEIEETRSNMVTGLEEVANTMSNWIKEEKKERTTLVARGTKLIKDLSNVEDIMKKTRAKYVSCREKQDKAVQQLEQAQALGPAPNKLIKAADKEEKKADKSDNEYRISVNNLKAAQDQFYEEDMPNLLNDFQDHFHERNETLKKFLIDLSDYQLPLGPCMANADEIYKNAADAIVSQNDLALFVQNNKPTEQPPARVKYESYDGIIQEVSGTPAPAAKKEKKKEPKTKKPKKSKKDTPPVSGGPTNTTTTTSPITRSDSVSESSAPPPPMDLPPMPPSSAPPRNGSQTEQADDEIVYLALYGYDAEDETELTFMEGEKIVLMETDDSGWWKGRNEKGEIGVFPSNYVESGGITDVGADFVILFDYQAEDETELSIVEGETVHVLTLSDGWYYARNSSGLEGNIPSNYCEEK
eukprot:TRINITY_DN6918_c0_g1_i2.p1 TRINITY_DN6918_c0_g1~~TRINITY_DN6918_c0_g1_i2.p1  ORF type:complete len:484 (+),score=161.55 TRINITY_DN6918_c0_g1_i2:19-1470(+)